MNVDEIRKEIKPFKENGMNSLSVKDIALYNLKKQHAMDVLIEKVDTKLTDHIEDHKNSKGDFSRHITWGISVFAIIVASYAAFFG